MQPADIEGVATVVLLNWRDEGRTCQLVRVLNQCRSVGKLIVVDNESTGALTELEDEFCGTVSVLTVPANVGYAAGINRGLSHFIDSGSSYLLVMNVDTVPNPRTVDLLVEKLISDPGSVFAPHLINVDGTLQNAGGRVSQISGLRTVESRLGRSGPHFLTWAFVAMSRSTLLKVGYLDERFYVYWEDVDWGVRARSLGIRLALASELSVIHERSVSARHARGRVGLYSAWGAGVFARKHRRYLVGFMLLLCGSFLSRTASGRPVLACRQTLAAVSGLVLRRSGYEFWSRH